MRRTRRIVTILAAAVAAALGGTTASAPAAPGDIGNEDFSYFPLGNSPTQTKPESKLWFNDGSWWGTMFAPGPGEHRIHRLNVATGVWSDTGTTIDGRNGANADMLWHGASGKLYAASHDFTETGTVAGPGEEGRLYRFSYDAASDAYSPDAGFPVTISAAKSESLVIAKDSTGRLWATWVQDGQVHVNHSLADDDASWGVPYVIPGSTVLDPDDLSSLAAFGGDKVGVMWSNQSPVDKRFWFAVHADGAGDADWSAAPLNGLPLTDDHISLKADGAGRVFAAVKTSENTPGTRPLTMLLRRNTNGIWDRSTFGTVSNSHTRPIVVLEEPGGRAHVAATCPQPPAKSGQSGGDICHKATPPNGLGLGGGIGPAVIRDLGSPEMNDVTSTKQSVNGLTGLVLLANNPTTDTYWHRFLSLGTPPPAVVAEFTATPLTGDAPLTVGFSDRSTGSPTSWSWSFGDFGTSTAHNPTHTYTRPGTYSVSLTAGTTTATNTLTKTALVTVTGTGPPDETGGGGGSAQRAVPQAVLGATATGRRVRITLFKRNLRGGRVRLSGSVAPRLSGVRVVLLRRSSTGRWSALRTARLQPFTRGRSRFAFVVKRLSRTVSYRIVVPAASGRTRSLSAALKVKRRR